LPSISNQPIGNQESPDQPLQVAIENAPTPTLIPFRILERQDWVRSITTIGFVSVFGLTVIFSFLVIFFGANWVSAKELIQLLLPAETALLGSALGFYFGSRSTE
jgi:hypothetical protein